MIERMKTMKNAVALNDQELETVAGGFGFSDLKDYIDLMVDFGRYIADKVKKCTEN